MKLYEVFSSEGGYRFAGGIWAGFPIIDQSPWFATEEEARRAAKEQKERDDARFDSTISSED